MIKRRNNEQKTNNMLTIQLIREETERVVKGLEKKNFAGAREAIDQVLAIDKLRRETQQRLDTNLSEAKKLAAEIGKLMKQGQRDEAEQVKAAVAQLKETNKQLEQEKSNAEHDLTTLLCQIPNIPYDEVPEGKAAEDNHVVKSNLKECDGTDTVGNWTCNPTNGEAKLPHWELAKKYNLIDFDLGVKITGAGFPVYIGQGARLQRALINFFLDEARKSGYTELMPPTVVNAASGYGTGQLPDKEGQMYHCEVDDFYLIPGNNRNTIYRNNAPVYAAQKLEDYDTLRFGETELLFVSFCNDRFRWPVEKS